MALSKLWSVCLRPKQADTETTNDVRLGRDYLFIDEWQKAMWKPVWKQSEQNYFCYSEMRIVPQKITHFILKEKKIYFYYFLLFISFFILHLLLICRCTYISFIHVCNVFIYSFILSFIYSLISFIHLYIHSFIHSFIYWFIITFPTTNTHYYTKYKNHTINEKTTIYYLKCKLYV